MMRPSPWKYCAQRATNSSNDSSDSWLPRSAGRTRTRAAGVRGSTASTFQTPMPPLPRFLLQHARLAFREALRQLAAELLQRRIETCVGAPAHVARPIEHFLRAHPQNQVRMRAHEHTVSCHITQNRIELRTVAVLADRIDPDEHTV